MANLVIGQLAEEFEQRSRAKFHSSDPAQVFSGASAVYNQTVEILFETILQAPEDVDIAKVPSKNYPELDFDLDLVDVPISFDDLMFDSSKKITDTMVKTTPSTHKESKDPETPLSKDQMLSAVTFNILNSIPGIDHLVFVEHNNKDADIFFQSGHLEDSFIQKTFSICDKYLGDIIEIMDDEDMENSIKITSKHQIIFVPIDEHNFIYAVGTMDVDAVMMKPVFERIAVRIKNMVLEYKESE